MITTNLEGLQTSLEVIGCEVTRTSWLPGGVEPRSGTRVGEGRGNIKHV